MARVQSKAAPKAAPKAKSGPPSGWTERARGEIVPWEEGMAVEGKLVEVRKAGNGFLLDLDSIKGTDGELVTYGCPTVLKSKLRGVAVGTPVYIECLGKVLDTANGVAWDFTVHTPAAGKQNFVQE